MVKKGQKEKKEKKEKEEIKRLKDALKKKERLIEEYIDDIKRIKADFENYKKQMLKEQTRAVELASERVITSLLSVLDNFERALTACENTHDVKGLQEGFNLIYYQLNEILNKEGLEAIKAKGEEFDPNLHEAMMRKETDKHEEDCILEVFEKGYKLKGKVIRPAKVKVAKKTDTGD